jgi:hypothetical protein
MAVTSIANGTQTFGVSRRSGKADSNLKRFLFTLKNPRNIPAIFVFLITVIYTLRVTLALLAIAIATTADWGTTGCSWVLRCFK